MDPFVRRLVERLLAPDQPLSRNRHFHTFENAEGRKALRVRRRLEGLARDLSTVASEGGAASLLHELDDEGRALVALRLAGPRGTRTAYLEPDELELLKRLPGVAAILARVTGT
jgi:hypothetical protein